MIIEKKEIIKKLEGISYESAYEAMEQYQPADMPLEGEDGDDLEEVTEKNEKAAREWLEDQTTVINDKHEHQVRNWLDEKLQIFPIQWDQKEWDTKEAINRLRAIADEAELRLNNPNWPSDE